MENGGKNMSQNEHNQLGDKHRNGKFGYFGFHPSCLQWLNSPWFFLVLVVLGVVCNTCAVVGVLAAFLPHIEKRFNLSGFDSGMVAAANDVPAVLLGLFVAHWGHYGNKVRWIGVGGIFTGIGFFIVTIPHYIIDDYRPPTAENVLCIRTNVSSVAKTACQDNNEIAPRYHLALILIGQFIAGLGTIPLFAFPPAIFRETLKPKHVPACLTMWQVSVFVGPLLAFSYSEAVLETWVDINKPKGELLIPEDPRWISAWWIAFLGPAAACFLVGLLTLGLPQHIRSDLNDNELKEIAKVDDGMRDMTLKEKMEKIPKILWELLRNPTYVFNVLAFNTALLFGEGLAPFIGKIMLLRFGVDIKDLGKILNIAVVPPLILGVTFSVILSRVIKIEESGKKAAFLCFLLHFGTISSPTACVLDGCKNVNMPGYSVPYGERVPVANGFNITKVYLKSDKFPLASTCNSDCNCRLNLAVPMCGNDGVTYLNPCFAGCTTPTSMLTFGNCSCIGSSHGYGGHGKVGFCDADCKNWLTFVLMISVYSLFIFAQLGPSKVVVMRSVKAEHLTFAFALHYLSNKLIANIPGPILFGHIVDLSCDIWQKVCGKNGFCMVYDLDYMMELLTIIAGSLSAAGIVFYFLSWIVFKDAEENNQVKPNLEISNLGYEADIVVHSVVTKL